MCLLVLIFIANHFVLVEILARLVSLVSHANYMETSTRVADLHHAKWGFSCSIQIFQRGKSTDLPHNFGRGMFVRVMGG